MGRTNFAPRMPTIIVALVFVVIGLLGTFVDAIPAIAGIEGDVIGAWSYVVALVILLLGVVFEGI